MKGGGRRVLQFVLRSYLKLFLATLFLALPSIFFSAAERSLLFDILLISSSTIYLLFAFLAVYLVRKAGRKRISRGFKVFVLQIYLVKLVIFLVHTIFHFDYIVLIYVLLMQAPIVLICGIIIYFMQRSGR